MDAGLIVLVALISPFRDDRDMARRLFGDGEFVEVFVDTPLALCEARDPKGLYARARKGEIGLPDLFADGMGRIAGQRTNVRRAALHTTRAGAELRAVNIDPFDVGSGLPQGVGSGAERLDDNSLRMGRSVEDKCFHGAAGFLPAPIVTLLR